ASRAVGVCSNLLSDELRADYVAKVAQEYENIRTIHAARGKLDLVRIEEARANAFAFDWAGYTPPKPRQLGLMRFEHYPLAEIAQYIDWSPFFNAWELAGKYPRILDDEVVGESARALFADGQAMLKQIIAEDWVQANGVIGLFPARRVGDDIE